MVRGKTTLLRSIRFYISGLIIWIMKEVTYVSGRMRDTLLIRINQTLQLDPTAELVAVVYRSNLYTAFIQFEKE